MFRHPGPALFLAQPAPVRQREERHRARKWDWLDETPPHRAVPASPAASSQALEVLDEIRLLLRRQPERLAGVVQVDHGFQGRGDAVVEVGGCCQIPCSGAVRYFLVAVRET